MEFNPTYSRPRRMSGAEEERGVGRGQRQLDGGINDVGKAITNTNKGDLHVRHPRSTRSQTVESQTAPSPHLLDLLDDDAWVALSLFSSFLYLHSCASVPPPMQETNSTPLLRMLEVVASQSNED